MIAVIPIMYQGIKHSCACLLPVSDGLLRKEVMLYNTNFYTYIAHFFVSFGGTDAPRCKDLSARS
jgi:hypothetical protein